MPRTRLPLLLAALLLVGPRIGPTGEGRAASPFPDRPPRIEDAVASACTIDADRRHTRRVSAHRGNTIA